MEAMELNSDFELCGLFILLTPQMGIMELNSDLELCSLYCCCPQMELMELNSDLELCRLYCCRRKWDLFSSHPRVLGCFGQVHKNYFLFFPPVLWVGNVSLPIWGSEYDLF
jgi:hypothetical protein